VAGHELVELLIEALAIEWEEEDEVVVVVVVEAAVVVKDAEEEAEEEEEEEEESHLIAFNSFIAEGFSLRST